MLIPRVNNLWDTQCVSSVEYTQQGTESTLATQTLWRFGTVAVNLVRTRIRQSPSQPFLPRQVSLLPQQTAAHIRAIHIPFPIWANQSCLSFFSWTVSRQIILSYAVQAQPAFYWIMSVVPNSLLESLYLNKTDLKLLRFDYLSRYIWSPFTCMWQDQWRMLAIL